MRAPKSDRSRQRLRTILTILVTALFIAPAAALATHGFSDVDNSDFFHAAVDWMDENDVTAGCNPPSNTRFCPDDFVTRGQMAVFLERLDSENVFVRPGDDAVDGGNADTVDGRHATDFLGANAKATDADKLDGINSSGFLRSTAKAADADKLDGKDSTAFLGAGDKATDAEKLDGLDSSAFATDAELDALDSFIPIAVITIINGTVLEPNPAVANFRAPITGAPTYANTDTGEYTIDLPGITFEDGDYPVVCSSIFGTSIVTTVAQFPGDPRHGDLKVQLFDHGGAPQADLRFDDFTCVVYDGT